MLWLACVLAATAANRSGPCGWRWRQAWPRPWRCEPAPSPATILRSTAFTSQWRRCRSCFGSKRPSAVVSRATAHAGGSSDGALTGAFENNGALGGVIGAWRMRQAVGVELAAVRTLRFHVLVPWTIWRAGLEAEGLA